MINYLSRIASRSISGQAFSLMPAKPAVKQADTDPFQHEITDKQQTHFPQMENSMLQETDLFKQTNQPGQVLSPSLVKEDTTRPLNNKSSGEKYFTRVAERMEPGEPIRQEYYQKSAGNFVNSITEPTNKHLVHGSPDNTEVRQAGSTGLQMTDAANVYEEQKVPLLKSERDNPVQEAAPSSTKISIGPTAEKPNVKHKRTDWITPVSTRLLPAHPHTVSNTKNIMTTPGLVIGKITVEVVQPDKPVPPRIVNRVIQTPTVAVNSKINKLSFGLGQL